MIKEKSQSVCSKFYHISSYLLILTIKINQKNLIIKIIFEYDFKLVSKNWYFSDKNHLFSVKFSLVLSSDLLTSKTNHFFLLTRYRNITSGRCRREYLNSFLEVELEESL